MIMVGIILLNIDDWRGKLTMRTLKEKKKSVELRWRASCCQLATARIRMSVVCNPTSAGNGLDWPNRIAIHPGIGLQSIRHPSSPHFLQTQLHLKVTICFNFQILDSFKVNQLNCNKSHQINQIKIIEY